MDKRDKVKKTTRKYFGAATSRQIAIDMGHVITHQQASLYLNEGSLPQVETLVKIIKSVSATKEARAWARDCMEIVLPDVEMTVSEPETDQVS